MSILKVYSINFNLSLSTSYYEKRFYKDIMYETSLGIIIVFNVNMISLLSKSNYVEIKSIKEKYL